MKTKLKIILILLLIPAACVPPGEYAGSFEGVFKLNSEYKCTGSDDKSNTIEAFIKGTKFKAITQTTQGTIESIGDVSDCIYGWIKGTSVGEQVCITKEDYKKGVNIFERSRDTGIKVNCTKFKVNDSLFEIPKNINFFPPTV